MSASELYKLYKRKFKASADVEVHVTYTRYRNLYKRIKQLSKERNFANTLQEYE